MTDQETTPDFSVEIATEELDCLRARLEEKLKETSSQAAEDKLLQLSGVLRLVENLLANRSVILHYGSWDFTVSLMDEVPCRDALDGSLKASGVHHNIDEDDGFTRVVLINVCTAEVDTLITESLSEVRSNLAGCK